jgi:hypothetical protein
MLIIRNSLSNSMQWQRQSSSLVYGTPMYHGKFFLIHDFALNLEKPDYMTLKVGTIHERRRSDYIHNA